MAQQARFQQNEWSVYIPKSQEGDPIGQPTSPRQETMMRRPVSVGMAAMGYVGYQVGTSVFRGVRNEIEARGNEELNRQVDNVLTAFSTATRYVVAAKVGASWGGPVGAVAMIAATSVADVGNLIVQQREIARENKDQTFERKLRGARVNYMGFDGAYHD